MNLKHSLYDALRILNENDIITSDEHNRFDEKVSTIPNEPIKSNVTITKKDFKEFERLRRLPNINMYCVGTDIVDYSNILTKEKVKIIFQDFDNYRHKFKG